MKLYDLGPFLSFIAPQAHAMMRRYHGTRNTFRPDCVFVKYGGSPKVTFLFLLFCVKKVLWSYSARLECLEDVFYRANIGKILFTAPAEKHSWNHIWADSGYSKRALTTQEVKLFKKTYFLFWKKCFDSEKHQNPQESSRTSMETSHFVWILLIFVCKVDV